MGLGVIDGVGVLDSDILGVGVLEGVLESEIVGLGVEV